MKLHLQKNFGIFDSVQKKNNKNVDNTVEEIVKNKPKEEIEIAKTNVKTEVIETDVINRYTNTYEGVQIKNESKCTITDEMLASSSESINKENILIYHTHTCESYTSSEKYQYTATGNFRTTDLNFSVAKVGSVLEEQLKVYKYNVVHDSTYHDYPTYTGSYDRSLTTVQNILKANENYDVIFDIHRDAIADSSYAPKVKIGDEYAAQLMFVIGTNGSGLDHDNWIENLKFAINVQKKADEMYPGLFKPIVVRNSRYNQHTGKASSIIEVGATGNTLDEANNSMKYLAKILSEVLR